MKLKRVRSIISKSQIAAMICLILGAVTDGLKPAMLSWAMIGVGVVLFIVSIIMTAKCWRCPKCHERLPYKQNFDTLSRCPYCGEILDLNS